MVPEIMKVDGAVSRRVVLGALASILVPPSRLHGQDAAVHLIPIEGEGARYWSRWRGPSGQGLVAGAGYPDTWSETQNIVWKTPVAGRGNSSPIVWRDRLFLTTALDGGRRLSVLAFRRSD